MYFLLKMVMFHCCVSLPEGINFVLVRKIFSSWPCFSSRLQSFRGLTSTRPTWFDQMKDLKVPVLVLAEGASAGGMGMKRFFKPFDVGVCVGTFDKSTIR